MHLFISMLIAIMFSGCTATYKQNLLAEPSAKLDKGKVVIIATPVNGFYESKEYSASGRTTALAIRSAFAQYTNSITVSTDCSDLACLQNLNVANYDYYVIPEILHWEDRATEWSGISDNIKVKIAIYEYQGWKELASAIVSGKSKWATFGGDHPQDLLPDLLNRYIDSLY